MRLMALISLAASIAGFGWTADGNWGSEARRMELDGKGLEALRLLEQAVKEHPADRDANLALAEFLDVHQDNRARGFYETALHAMDSAGAPSQDRLHAARRLVYLDLLNGDRKAAEADLAAFRPDIGAPWTLPPPMANTTYSETIDIPGPLISFARMAALSPSLAPDDLLPALARNIVVNGYHAQNNTESLQQTEYLKLVIRYLSQARELEKLAGTSHKIRVEACESAVTADLLRVLGFRMRGGCGTDLVLETVNATRAFLSMDSGFPLAQLEQSLRTNRPFELDYSPTKVPIRYGETYWLSDRDKDPKKKTEFIDAFLEDPVLCRLYLGMNRLDDETAKALTARMPVQKVKLFSHVLDFFGGNFAIRDGKAIVPGGARSEKAWEDIVGVSPSRGGEFLERLLARDDGWMASYFDSLSRISGPTEEYLTSPERLKRFYLAIRGKVTSPGPARPVFRSNTDLMFLTTRLWLDPNGQPHIPGGVASWQYLFAEEPIGSYDKELKKAARDWKSPDDVVEALFAMCRKVVENQPLKLFMTLDDVDRERKQPLQPDTVRRLIDVFPKYGDQYSLFAEASTVSDGTIVAFLVAAAQLDKEGSRLERADALGTFQSLVSLWQIFVRNHLIPDNQVDFTLRTIVQPFLTAKGELQFFDAGRAGVEALLKATGAPAGVDPQERMLDLLAGAPESNDSDSHQQLVLQMRRVFDAQRLVGLDSIFNLVDHLDRVAQGEKLKPELVSRVSSKLEDIEPLRNSLTGPEKNSFAFGFWADKHVDGLRKLRLRQEIAKAAAKPDSLKQIRGKLLGVLRDTLVGLNYAHYVPPGAQIIYTNPLFVRSHDFLGLQEGRQSWHTAEVYGSGWPMSAGGRLVGSLIGLPYALASAEQNFLIPTEEQALIWGDLVPQLLISAKVPRWWHVTPGQLHWITLHLRYADSVMAESVFDAGVRDSFLQEFGKLAPPARVRAVEDLLKGGDLQGAALKVLPSEKFHMSEALIASHHYPASPLADDILQMEADSPATINYVRISGIVGTPKPVLTHSYRPELLNLRTFPTLMGYSSRIMAESWESNNIYFASLADELHLAPAKLNVRVPEWTAQTVEQIFATHLEDWPALFRSLLAVGNHVRSEAQRAGEATQNASLYQ